MPPAKPTAHMIELCQAILIQLDAWIDDQNLVAKPAHQKIEEVRRILNQIDGNPQLPSDQTTA